MRERERERECEGGSEILCVLTGAPGHLTKSSDSRLVLEPLRICRVKNVRIYQEIHEMDVSRNILRKVTR